MAEGYAAPLEPMAGVWNLYDADGLERGKPVLLGYMKMLGSDERPLSRGCLIKLDAPIGPRRIRERRIAAIVGHVGDQPPVLIVEPWTR